MKRKGIGPTGPVDVERVNASRFSVFPNPGQGWLSLHFPDQGDYEIRVYSATGSLVNQKHMSGVSGTISLDLSSLPEGIYFLNIRGEELRETVKYMKE